MVSRLTLWMAQLENNLTAVPEELLPYAEAAIEPAPQFMGFVNAAQSLFELGFIGERVELNVLDGLTQHDGSARATMKLTLFVLFVCFVSRATGTNPAGGRPRAHPGHSRAR